MCIWEAHPPKRRAVTAVGGTAGHGLPHDLLQFLVERELRQRYGFFGWLADGATFRSLEWGGRRRTPQGRAVIGAHVDDLDAAEDLANAHNAAWRNGAPTPLAPVFDEMRARWLALPEGGEIELDFPLGVTPAGRAARQTPCRR